MPLPRSGTDTPVTTQDWRGGGPFLWVRRDAERGTSLGLGLRRRGRGEMGGHLDG